MKRSLNSQPMKALLDVDPFSALPDEALYHLFSCLPGRGVGACALVCRRWGGMARLPELWAALASRRWRNTPPSEYPKANPSALVPIDQNGSIAWREYYLIRDVFDSYNAGRCCDEDGVFDVRSLYDLKGFHCLFIIEILLLVVKNGQQEMFDELLKGWINYLCAFEIEPIRLWKKLFRKNLNVVVCASKRFGYGESLMRSIEILLESDIPLTADDLPVVTQYIQYFVQIFQNYTLKNNPKIIKYFEIHEAGFVLFDDPIVSPLVSFCERSPKLFISAAHPMIKHLFQSDKEEDILTGAILLAVGMKSFCEYNQHDEIILLVLNCIQHGLKRVKQVGWKLVDILSAACCPEFQMEYHSVVLPLLFQKMKNKKKRNLEDLTILFYEHDDRPFSYMNQQLFSDFLPQLLSLPLESLPIPTLDTILISDSDGAYSISPAFYHPLIKTLLQMLKSEEKLTQKLSILDCLSYCCISCGKSCFTPYISETVNCLVEQSYKFTHLDEIDTEDYINCSRYLSSWKKVFETFQEDMSPYLHLIITCLLPAFELDFYMYPDYIAGFRDLFVTVLENAPIGIGPYLHQIEPMNKLNWRNGSLFQITLLKAREINGLPLNISTDQLVEFLSQFKTFPTQEGLSVLKHMTEMKFYDSVPVKYYPNILPFFRQAITKYEHENKKKRTLLTIFEVTVKKAPKLAYRIIKTIFEISQTGYNSAINSFFFQMLSVLLNHTDNINSKILNRFIPFIWNHLTSNKIEPHAIYSLGLLALKYPKQFVEELRVSSVIDGLLQFTKKDVEKERLCIRCALDNCVGALGRILKAFPTPENIERVFPQYIALLPLKYNQEDNLPQFEILVELLSRNDLPEDYLSCPNLQNILSSTKCPPALKEFLQKRLKQT